MLTMLAQNEVPVQETLRRPDNIFEIVNALLAEGDALTHGQKLTEILQQMSLVWAMVFLVAGCLALLLAVCCFPLMKYAVALMGGLAGAFIGANVWSAVAGIMFEADRAQEVSQSFWVGALVGLLVCGMLAFILFKLSVMLFTSVSGSTLAVLGAIALLLQVPTWQDTIVTNLSAHPIIIPLMVLVPTVIGILMQQYAPQQGKASPA